MIKVVAFDLDGVLIDSEPVWEQVCRTYVEENGGRWPADAQDRLMAMSTFPARVGQLLAPVADGQRARDGRSAPPVLSADALDAARVVATHLDELTVSVIEGLGER